MKRQFLCLVCAMAAGAAAAGSNDFVNFHLDKVQAIQSGEGDHVPGAKGSPLFTLTGSCGTATITLTGVERTDNIAKGDHDEIYIGQYYATQNVKAEIVTPGKKIANDALGLDGMNQFACVDTPKGKRIVIAAWCSARECEPVSYTVIEPGTGKDDTPAADICNARCAEKALGGKLPKFLLTNG